MAHRIWLPLLLVVFVFTVTVVFCGASFLIYIDLPSLLLVPVAPFLFMILSHGWSATRSAFSVPLDAAATKRGLETSVSFWKSFGTAIWCFGAVGSTSGVIALLANITDRNKVGPNTAVALITAMYAALFSVGLVLPFLSASRKRLAELE
jgi:flagellar motor component MotA